MGLYFPPCWTKFNRTYEARTFFGLGVSRCRTRVRVGYRHVTDTYNYIELCHFFKLLSVSTCPCRVQCLCPCFIDCWSFEFDIYIYRLLLLLLRRKHVKFLELYAWNWNVTLTSFKQKHLPKTSPYQTNVSSSLS
jgi:hypothetical protein